MPDHGPPPEPIRAPLIIVGAVRSGTTLLHLMLGGHPSIRIFGEFEESVKLLGDTGWIAPRAFLDGIRYDRVYRSRDYDDPPETTYPEMVHHLAAQMCRGHEPDVHGWVIHSRFDRAPELWPDARYLHIVRDPRDVARSCIGMGWAGHVWFSTPTWIEAERRWDRVCERVEPERRHEIRYEDLVRAPRESITAVLDFLGLPWSDDVFAYTEGSTYDAPDASLAEQWKRKMSPRDIELVEARCGPLLTARGYEPASAGTPSPPGFAERVGLRVTHRRNLLRMAVKKYGLRLVLERAIMNRLPIPRGWEASIRTRLNAINTAHLK